MGTKTYTKGCKVTDCVMESEHEVWERMEGGVV